MGWRAWDAYDTEAKERWRALPWRQRYSWRRVALFALIVLAMLAWAKFARAETDAQIVANIIQASRNEYYATGHPCACPFDHARNGSSCGARSAYSRPGGAEPKCYPKDVSKAEIDAYRKAHP
jgi:hypothetical protein